MRKLTTAVLALGVAGATMAGTGAATASPLPVLATGHGHGHGHGHHGDGYTPPPIEWGECSSPRMQAAGARCGLLTVPLDYAHPDGTKIKIGVSEIKHKTSDADAQGIMLVNPGGPGGSGLNLARLGAFVPNGGGDPYDWIGFDPRGVGTSQPNLSCDGDYFPYDRPDYVPFTRQLERTWLHKAAGYASACAQVGGELLDHMKTTDWVNDMESIRKAFGADKINYYGFSYGTYLGQVYATMHPDRVRRMVFDGVVNPKDVWYQANLNQDLQFDKNIKIYFDWVAAHNDVYGLGTSGRQILKLYYAMQDKARKAPFDGKIGPDEWNDAFVSAAYYVYGWEQVAQAFKAAVDGDYGPIVALYDGANGSGPGSDNTYAVYNAVQCTDTTWPRWPKQRRDSWRTYHKAPFLTWNNTWYNAPCLTWAGESAHHPVNVRGTKVPPILLIEETNDAATPYAGALEVRKRFPRSVLIEGVGGTTHAGSLSGVTCTDDRIADYLLTGALDPRKPGRWTSDVQCEPVPAPDPSPAPAAATRSLAPQTAAPGAASGATDRLPSDLRSILQQAQLVG